MNQPELQPLIADLANEYGIPGVAAGIWHRGKMTYACHGVTSIENPLPVDRHTLFQAGSICKTVTATALVLLEAEGDVELDAPVRRYVPELQLADAAAAARVTLRQILNHTAGWEGDFFPDTGEGDDALAGLVSRLNELAQLTPPGAVVSYNNAAFCLAGRVIENVTGESYEGAIRRLILQPLGLHESFFFPGDIMTRRFVVGHKPAADDAVRVARPWAMPRNGAPAGGIVTSINDLLAWARLHAGDRHCTREPKALSTSRLRAMHDPTAHVPGCAFGDAVGISWFLSDIGGHCLVGHDGSTNGQEASLSFLPDHGWALALLTNASPGGLAFNRVARRRVLEACTGIIEQDPEPGLGTPGTLAEYAGNYGARGMRCQVAVAEAGDLELTLQNDPELLALMAEGDEVPESQSMTLRAGLVRGRADRFVFADVPVQGVTGYFDRAGDGGLRAIHLFGRWLPRLAP